MRLEIYEPEAAPEEKRVRLKLEQGPDGGARVIAVDADGTQVLRGVLLVFTSDGWLYRTVGVNPDLGFQLDTEGRIKLDED